MVMPSMELLSELTEGAVHGVLAHWRAVYPEMGVVALVPEAEKAGVADLQRVCAASKVPLAGAIFPALLTHEGFVGRGAWLLRLDHMPYVALYPDLPRDQGLTAVLDELVEAILPQLGEGDEVTLLMVFDAMVRNIGSILDELYLRLANRVHYLGVNAGSETFQPMPCLFDGERLVENGLLVMLLEPHRGGALEHGYAVPEQTITATSTEGNRIIQIDWRPAFEVYQELARAQYGVQITRENFYRNAVHFPFGIMRANGITVVRIPVALEDDGSLFCVGEVPPNAILTLLQAPSVDTHHTLETVVKGLGELYIPSEILSRPGKLMDLEYQLIQSHPQVGYEILQGVELPWPVADIIVQHHERLDGSGYPKGLKGDAIVPEARLLAVADVVEAMAVHRPYRPALGVEAGREQIIGERGVLFDPAMVDACVTVVRKRGFRFD